MYDLVFLIVLITSIFFLCTSTLFFIKFKKLKIIINEINIENRLGYFISGKGNSVIRIYVEELEKYKNGESKLKYIRFEVLKFNHYTKYELRKFTRKLFYTSEMTTIMKTNSITWLESDDTIKTTRKNKLKKIMKK